MRNFQQQTGKKITVRKKAQKRENKKTLLKFACVFSFGGLRFGNDFNGNYALAFTART